jgi:asparagine synthase (glutamine-hydrolysing)
MGALFFILHNLEESPLNKNVLNAFMKMQNRGRDDTSIITETTPNINQMNNNQAMLTLSKRELREYKPITLTYGYHRMCINDMTYDGSQPFEDPIMHKIREYPELRNRLRRKMMCNGEIYNYNEIKESEGFTSRDLQSTSDVEIILPLYIKYGLMGCLEKLNGDYAFILSENTNTFDLKNMNIYAVRDICGMKPLYMIRYREFNMNNLFYMFTSELKGLPREILNDRKYVIQEVPNGTYWSFNNSIILKNKTEFINYYSLDKYKNIENCIYNNATPEVLTNVYNNIRDVLIDSVVKRYTLSMQKTGFLLSGFDSAIILAIVIKYLQKENYDFDKDPIQVFTFGDIDGKDVISAKECVSFLETTYSIDIHHHIISIQNVGIVISELDDIIYSLETYDKNLIRKNIPYAFLCKYISEKTDVKVLLTGEGLDEMCGYDELFKLDDIKFQERSIEMINNNSDIIVRDKIAGNYNLEVRHPFLDKRFIELMLEIHPILKRPQKYDYSKGAIEKYIVRKAFDNSIVGSNFYVNKTLLWKARECISKSVKCIKIELEKYFENVYSDHELYNYIQYIRQDREKLNYPKTKEEMYYMKIWERLYNSGGNDYN